MRLGITMFATDRSMDVVALAPAPQRSTASRSLYLPEHTHIPISRRTPPPTGEAELAEEYRRTLDPLVALAACASVTTSLRLGTGVALVAQREPIVTAKAVASLDLLSGVRVTLGIGFGWNADELEHHGVAMAERRVVPRAEHVLTMQALWRQDEAAFHGEHVHLDPSWSWPKPVQPGGPPVLLGGAAGPKLFAHIAEYGDGWIPIGGGGVREALPQLHAATEAAGRDPQALSVIPFGTMPDRGRLEYYATLGIDEVVLRVPSAPEAEVLPVLERAAALVAELTA